MSFDAPSGPPPSGPPETLDFGGGQPIPPSGGGRRGLLVVVAAVGAVAVAGASWAAWSFLSTGPQPAQALPGSTIAYVSVDLDPSGGQKIEALRTLRKFPAFKEHVGLDTDDDIREWIFGEIQGDCDDLDYADDVEPWLGDRFGIAAVDVEADQPAAVFVLQVSDEDAADQGLAAIKKCNGAGVDEGAWVIRDGWVVLAETQEIAQQVADDAATSPLSADEDFQHWTDQVGDSGVISMYAAPEAGKLMADELSSAAAAVPDAIGSSECTMDDDGEVVCDESSFVPDETIPVPVPQELEQATQASGSSVGDLTDEVAATLGITLPDDVETLVGDALAIAIGPDFDPTVLESGSTAVPGVGVKIVGDADGIDGVLDKLRTAAGGADQGVLDSDASDGAVAVGPDADYSAQLLEGGDLGGNDTYRRVIEHG